jgi:hypothetical protein
MALLTFPAKMLRAEVIKAHMDASGYRRAVCISCGNAAQALREQGMDVLEIGAHGLLQPGRWLAPWEVARQFPTHFDATSGHLPVPLMGAIGRNFRAYLVHRAGGCLRTAEVPTGSGETVCCLAWAMPEMEWTAVYNVGPGTKYEPDAPLNGLVWALCQGRVKNATP